MARQSIRLGFGRKVQIPLQTIAVGRGSVLELEITGAPEGLQNVQLHVGRIGRSDFVPVTATPMPDNRWAVYANGLNFPDEGRTKYHLTGRDERDGSVWLGSGTLLIMPSVLNVDGAAAPIVPEDTYLLNPETGLWHKLTCTIEDGDMVPEISKEGIAR